MRMEIQKDKNALSTMEKVAVLVGKDLWTTATQPSIIMTDGPHGVRLSRAGKAFFDSYPATAFPVEAAMAATWNESLIEEMSHAMAAECQHYGVGVLLGPGLNGKRSPLAGRNFEYFSEDPFLTGKMGAAFIRGLQSGGVGASAKHFVGNEQETNRKVTSSEIDERTLREIYLLPFEMVIKEAQPWTVMCSYNRLNGSYVVENARLLMDLLKKEWQYKGVILSDWGAVWDAVQSIKNGLDLIMPYESNAINALQAAMDSGLLKESEIEDSIYRILTLVKKITDNKKQETTCDFDHNHRLAQRVAEEAIVLLKNDFHILPLKHQASLAVLGRFAEIVRFQGEGSSYINPMQLDIPLDEISKYAKTIYGMGYDKEFDENLLEEAKELAEGKEAVIIFVGSEEVDESEGYDREDIKLPLMQRQLIEEVAKVNPNIVLVVHSGSVLELKDVEGYAKAILYASLPGQAGATAIAELLFGVKNPSGKLAETFPIALEHGPAFLNFPGTVEQVHYKEGIFVGYRYYDTTKLSVLYPFGFGLSYTTYSYSNLRLSHHLLSQGEQLIIKFDIMNTGQVAGKEIIQIYVSDQEASFQVPDKELKGFVKVNLCPGESKTVEITLDERAFSHYINHLERFAVETGAFDILVGASSRDIRLKDSVIYQGDEEIKQELTQNHSIRDWIKDNRTKEKMQAVMQLLNIGEDNHSYQSIIGSPLNRIFTCLDLEDKREEAFKILGIKSE